VLESGESEHFHFYFSSLQKTMENLDAFDQPWSPSFLHGGINE